VKSAEKTYIYPKKGKKMSTNTILKEEKLRKKIAVFLCSKQNEITLNISKLNFIEASRIALLNSTKCYVENPNKKINWIVKNEVIKNLIQPFKLNNMEITTH